MQRGQRERRGQRDSRAVGQWDSGAEGQRDRRVKMHRCTGAEGHIICFLTPCSSCSGISCVVR